MGQRDWEFGGRNRLSLGPLERPASPDHFSEGTARAQTALRCWVLVTACVTLGYSLTSLCPQFPYPCLWPVMVLTFLGSYEHLMNSHL